MVKKAASTPAMKARKADSPVRLEDYIDKVKAKAFELFLDRERNGRAGDEISDWVQAEKEIKAKYNIK